MALPCGPVFFPAVTHVVRGAVHAAGRMRSHIGHHVVHHVHHALHAMHANPAAAIGFACRAAPGWTVASLLALPLLQPSQPVPAQPSIKTPLELQGLQTLRAATPLPVQQAFDTDGPFKASTSAASAPPAAIADKSPKSPVAPQIIARAFASPIPTSAAPLPLSSPRLTPPATAPYSTVPPDRIPQIIASEFPASSQPVPEPSSLLVLTSGFYSLRWIRRRHQPIVGNGT